MGYIYRELNRKLWSINFSAKVVLSSLKSKSMQDTMQDLTMTTNEDGWLAVQLHGSAPGEFPNLLLHNDDILLALSGASASTVPPTDEKNLPALTEAPPPMPTPTPTPPSTPRAPREPTPAEAARYKQRRSAAAQHRNKRHAARQRKQRAGIFKDRLEKKHALLEQRLVPRKRNCKKKEKEDEEGKEKKGNEDEDDHLEDEDDLLELLILTVLLPLVVIFLFALMYVAPSSTPWVCWHTSGAWFLSFLYGYLVYLKYHEEKGTSNEIPELPAL